VARFGERGARLDRPPGVSEELGTEGEDVGGVTQVVARQARFRSEQRAGGERLAASQNSALFPVNVCSSSTIVPLR
jgi:hypothetical protein